VTGGLDEIIQIRSIVSNNYLYGCFEFFSLDANDPKFFGFSEFLAGLALMVLAWTIADIRYRFRIKTAPIPLERITFGVVTALGVLTLLTDLWRAERWLVPRGNLISPSEWQALLGGLFLMTFLTWVWFAFIRPPVYGKRNAKRYAQTLYRFILKGSSSELSVVADELSLSARSLIHYATERSRDKNFGDVKVEDGKPTMKSPNVTAYANDMLLLIADKRFCRAIVESAPGTALTVFHEIGIMKKYGIKIEIFAKNIVNEALANKNSFLFHEAGAYESGLIGYHKPLSQAMFSNYRMVEEIGTLLDPDMWEKDKWDADQWKAYCRIVLITLRDYVAQGYGEHSFVLYRAKGYIQNAAFDLYKINEMTSGVWESDAVKRLRVVIRFIKDTINIFDEKKVPEGLQLRVRKKNGARSFYDYLADMIFEVIFCASAVSSPRDLCWAI